jgi:peptidoglycan DL-endopeptidase CwlO
VSAATDVRPESGAEARPRRAPTGAAARARYPAPGRPGAPPPRGAPPGPRVGRATAGAARAGAARAGKATGRAVKKGVESGKTARRIKKGAELAGDVGLAVASGGTSAVAKLVGKQALKQGAKKAAKKTAQKATKGNGRWLRRLIVVAFLIGPGGYLAMFVAIAAAISSALPESASTTRSGWSKDAEHDIPLEYLRLYEAAVASQCPKYPAALLAAIGKVESDHGRSTLPGVHSAANSKGAAGPMQIGIGGAASRTWYQYAVDGNNDGKKDVYDPADAIFTAARYECAHWDKKLDHLYRAVWAYNPIKDASPEGLGCVPYTKLKHRVRVEGSGIPMGCWYLVKVFGWYHTYEGPSLPVPQAPSALAGKAVQIALAQVGKGYILGTEGPKTFDCSGLTWYAYKHAGLRWTRMDTKGQYKYGQLLPGSRTAGHDPDLDTLRANLRPGDLVFYDVNGDPLHHMAMYLGNGWQVAAANPDKGVVRQRLILGSKSEPLVGATRPTAPRT